MTDKTILVVGEERKGELDTDTITFGDGDRVIVRDVSSNPEGTLRGYSADLVVLVTSISDDVRDTILEPMVAVTGGDIIDLT